MGGFSLALLTIGLAGGIAFFRIPLLVWSLLVVSLLFIFQALHWIGPVVGVCGILFCLVILPLNIPFLRRFFTKKLFYWFVSVLPFISQTEKEAIEAGDVGWEKQLFQGKPQWQQFITLPKPSLNDAEQQFLDNQVETLCAMLNDWEIVHELSDLPKKVWDYLKTEKFFGIIIPKSYGGLEFSPLAHSSIITKIATRSTSAAVTAMVPNSLGPAELLLHYGTQKQKEYYLPRLADGREIPCFALTGPQAGSDAGAIPDKGIICKGEYQGKEIVGIRLTFDKRYITLAPIASVLGVAFKLYDPHHLLSEKTDRGITLGLIPTDMSGIEVGHRHFPMGLGFMNGPIRAKDLFIPLDWIIGGESQIGQGWRMLMESLAAGRGISLPALSTAAGAVAYCTSGAYAAIRQQFNLPIGMFEGIEEALTPIAGFTYMLQATRVFTAQAIGQGKRPALATAIAKYHMTEMARKVVNAAMDIHAGRGIMLGPMNYLARGYQSIPISITVEGANILTRSLMIFGQGAIRCHPYVKEEIYAAQLYGNQPKKALKEFDKLCIKHIGYLCQNITRCLIFSLSRGHFSHVKVNDSTRIYLKRLNWLSAGLAVIADLSLILLGGSLKRKEKLSARLGDVLSHLYLASMSVKYYYDEGRQSSDWPTVEWGLQYSLYQAQEAFYGFFDNFPKPWIGKIIKCITFPFGKAFSLPNDKLGQKIAHAMLSNSTFREKLLSLCYIDKNENEALSLIEMTFQQSIILQPLLEKIKQAINNKMIEKKLSFEQQVTLALEKQLINDNEAISLRKYDNLCQKAIAVDEFTSDYFLGTQTLCHMQNLSIPIK